jgi:hypothetical protein
VPPASDPVAPPRDVSPAPVVHAVRPWAQHSSDVLRSVRVEAITDAVDAFPGATVDAHPPRTQAAASAVRSTPPIRASRTSAP